MLISLSMKSLILFFTLLFSTIVIAESSGRPEWVSGSSDQYPASQYLVGVGDSPGQGRAKEKARADLVKTIQIKIDASSKTKEQVETHETDSELTEDVRRTTTNDINTSSQVEMKNIVISDTWYDESAETYYALATLARDKASDVLSQEISQLDEETKRYVSRTNDTKDFEKISNYYKAMSAQNRRKVLSQYLLAINSSASAIGDTPYTVDTLRSRVQKAQRKISIMVNATGEEQRSLSLLAKSGLNSLAYQPTNSSSALYVLDIELVKEPAIFKDDIYWVFATLEMKLRNSSNRKVLGACSWSLKEASQHRNRAHSKIIDAVKDVFDSEFNTVFNNFITLTPCQSDE